MPTRRTVLVAGTALAAVAAVGGGTALVLGRRTLPLTLAALQPLVGTRFAVEDAAGAAGATRTELTLTGLTGVRGGEARHDAFRLLLVADQPVHLPGAIRTFTHADGDLVLHTEPVGDAGTTLEAVVVLAA